MKLREKKVATLAFEKVKNVGLKLFKMNKLLKKWMIGVYHVLALEERFNFKGSRMLLFKIHE